MQYLARTQTQQQLLHLRVHDGLEKNTSYILGRWGLYPLALANKRVAPVMSTIPTHKLAPASFYRTHAAVYYRIHGSGLDPCALHGNNDGLTGANEGASTTEQQVTLRILILRFFRVLLPSWFLGICCVVGFRRRQLVV